MPKIEFSSASVNSVIKVEPIPEAEKKTNEMEKEILLSLLPKTSTKRIELKGNHNNDDFEDFDSNSLSEFSDTKMDERKKHVDEQLQIQPVKMQTT